MLNEGARGAAQGQEAFSEVLNDERVQTAVAEGARVVRMPLLPEQVKDLDQGGSLREVVERLGDAETTPFVLARWLRQMDENFAPVVAAIGLA